MFRISLKKTYWFLFLILPFMDTLNGLLNKGGNENGLSLGIIYRIVVLLMAIYMCVKGNIVRKPFISCIFVLMAIVISTLIGSANASEYISRIFRLLLPIILIISFEFQPKANPFGTEYSHSILTWWSILFPTTIIIPFILRLGFNTYGLGGAGYKGFYFAQNDIGYILAVLYLFMIFEIAKGFTTKKIVVLLLLLVSNLMLGLKSNYMLVVAITIGFIFISSRKLKTLLSKVFVIITIILGIYIVSLVYSSEIELIIARWTYLYNSREFMSFWTSARWDRVEPAYNWINSSFGIVGILFGSGVDYTYHTMIYKNIIEMDMLDIFFQMGAVGLMAVYGFYFRVLKDYHFKGFCKYGFWLSIIIGVLAGHVMESALSGMFLAMICGAGIIENREEVGPYEKSNETI